MVIVWCMCPGSASSSQQPIWKPGSKNSRETAAKNLQQAMFTGRKDGFGSSLIAKPGKWRKKTATGAEED
jgi:hypothetical protein